jgi:hypothetical protein
VSVSYVTEDLSAVAGEDYVAVTGTLLFQPDEVSKQVQIPLIGDSMYEGDEEFSFLLTAPFGVEIFHGTAIVTIHDDDAAPEITVTAIDPNASEAGSDAAVFAVSRSVNLSGDVTVTTTFAGTADQGVDYSTVVDPADLAAGVVWNSATGILLLPDGVDSAHFTVVPDDDDESESDETIILSLSNPVGGALGSATSAIATILDDDGAVAPSLSVEDVAVVEGDKGGFSVDVSVSLNFASTTPVSVFAETVDIGSATAGRDYRHASTTIIFDPGTTNAAFRIRILNDRLAEGDETLEVHLSNATGADILDGVATIRIIDNDVVATAAALAVAVEPIGEIEVDAVSSVSSSNAIPLRSDLDHWSEFNTALPISPHMQVLDFFSATERYLAPLASELEGIHAWPRPQIVERANYNAIDIAHSTAVDEAIMADEKWEDALSAIADEVADVWDNDEIDAFAKGS